MGTWNLKIPHYSCVATTACLGSPARWWWRARGGGRTSTSSSSMLESKSWRYFLKIVIPDYFLLIILKLNSSFTSPRGSPWHYSLLTHSPATVPLHSMVPLWADCCGYSPGAAPAPAATLPSPGLTSDTARRWHCAGLWCLSWYSRMSNV